ncbi:MAG: hypothetical protein HY836_14010 [Aquabacterium sp.]|uniref:hypothetical protein n=1 Tax=Aquabacterium sp. TaxID=1872578 RepID=UPI0025C663C3|nr:hypothetical protein [Aquabacterium sp.]MBI5926700.1 hypothetical protein [Aquabacterium sp.]
MSKQLSQKLYAIKPVCSGGQRGWSVEICRQGNEYRKCFTASRHGGTEAALLAAIAWRDEIASMVKTMTLAAYCSIERRNNSSGHPGVYLMRTLKKDRAGNVRVHVSWEARTPAGLKPPRKKSFSVEKYGEGKAYELAVNARNAFVAELDGYLQRRVPTYLLDTVVPAKTTMQKPTE